MGVGTQTSTLKEEYIVLILEHPQSRVRAHVCMCVCVHIGSHRGHQKASDSRELELPIFMRYPMLVLGSKLPSAA